MDSLFKKFKSNIFLSTCFIFLFTIISCEKTDKPDLDTDNARAKMLKHIVPLDSAFNMYNTYSKTRSGILKDTLQKLYGEKFYDTRTVWFDIETLKEYIKYVEQKSRENNIDPQGFKICFGTYSNDKNLGDVANHQNVFLVPTTENKGRQSAYTIQNEKGVVFLKNVKNNNQSSIKTSKAGFVSFTSLNGSDGLILNRGGATPPPSSGDPDFE